MCDVNISELIRLWDSWTPAQRKEILKDFKADLSLSMVTWDSLPSDLQSRMFNELDF